MNPASPCERMREHLDAYLSRELAVEATRDLDRHLANCPQCAAELAARARLRDLLQAAVRATPLPAALEANVRRAVSGQPARPRTGLWAVAAAAAVILCALLLNQLRVQSNPEEAILRKASGRFAALLKVGLRDHLNCAVFRKYSLQPLPAAEMAADLGPQFAGLVQLVNNKLWGDYRVIQGHRCDAGGRQYTHLILAGGPGGAKIVSVVITRKRPGESLAGGIHQAGVDRFQVVGFETREYLAYVISDLDPQQNLQLAANLAPMLREYLTAL